MKTSLYLTLITSLFLTLEAFSTELRILDKKIKVDGKEATLLSLAQPDGTLGLEIENGRSFDVLLKNTIV